MTNSIVLQHICRAKILGIDIDTRLNIADEPLLEAEQLGQLLEYKRHRKCRELVQRLVDDGRLSCTAPRRGAPQNSADNSQSVGTDHPPADVYAVEVIEPHGVRFGTTEQLWLTERACLLVATASETERAWQVRTALVDFFLAYRRQGLRNGTVENSSMAGLELIRDEVRQLVDEARAIEQRVVHSMAIDTRLRALEARQPRQPPQQPSPTDALRAVVLHVLAEHPNGLTTSELLDIARDDIDAARGRTTTAMPLGREIGRMPEIERRWRHGHVSVWALKHREPS